MYKGGEELGGERPVTIWVQVSPSEGLIVEDEGSIPAGAPVVVFANALSSNQGWTAAMEGLATACPGELPIGLTGTTGEWTEVTSLDDLAARLEVAANP